MMTTSMQKTSVFRGPITWLMTSMLGNDSAGPDRSRASAGPFPIPAFPAKIVRDPTGAGDSFAGGLLGYLAEQGKHDTQTLRRALVHGTIAASFAIEDFSLERVRNLTRTEVNKRVDQFVSMLRFD